jgi:hypothetical protein
MGNMLEFGSPVMFRVSGKVAGGIMQERWFPGVWVGKKLHTDEHMVMKEDGLVVRSRAVRETSVELTMQDYDKLKSTPHDPLGTIRSAIASTRPPVPLKDDKEEELEYRPRRAKLTQEVVKKFGFTAGCPKCRSLERGEGAGVAIGHSSKCRERLEARMQDDPIFKDRLERAETRINENLARYVEAHDPDRQGGEKRARVEPAGVDPRDAEGDQDMGIPEAFAQSVPASVPSAVPYSVAVSSSATAAASSNPGAVSSSSNVVQSQDASWEALAARIKRGPEPMAAEPDSQRQRLELVDVAVEADIRGCLAKLRSSEFSECLKQGRKSGAIGAVKSQPATLKRSPQDCQGDFGERLKTSYTTVGLLLSRGGR